MKLINLTYFYILYSNFQCCGSERFLTGSESDFRKRPEPDQVPDLDLDLDPDLNKFSAQFLLKILLAEICT
jgi:hypothetical protein